MAKQIVILNNSKGPGGDQNIVAAFWLAVVTGQQISAPAAVSAWRGASAAENSALQSGSVLEQIYQAQYPATYTLAQIESALQTAYSSAQTSFNALPNPNIYYGAFYDGTAWNAAGALPPGNILPAQFGSKTLTLSGDTTIISGAANQSISILQMHIAAAAAVTLQVKDGVSIIGAHVFPAGGGNDALHHTPIPWYVFSAGTSFVINSSAAVNVVVSGWYRQA